MTAAQATPFSLPATTRHSIDQPFKSTISISDSSVADIVELLDSSKVLASQCDPETANPFLSQWNRVVLPLKNMLTNRPAPATLSGSKVNTEPEEDRAATNASLSSHYGTANLTAAINVSNWISMPSPWQANLGEEGYVSAGHQPLYKLDYVQLPAMGEEQLWVAGVRYSLGGCPISVILKHYTTGEFVTGDLGLSQVSMQLVVCKSAAPGGASSPFTVPATRMSTEKATGKKRWVDQKQPYISMGDGQQDWEDQPKKPCEPSVMITQITTGNYAAMQAQLFPTQNAQNFNLARPQPVGVGMWVASFPDFRIMHHPAEFNQLSWTLKVQCVNIEHWAEIEERFANDACGKYGCLHVVTARVGRNSNTKNNVETWASKSQGPYANHDLCTGRHTCKKDGGGRGGRKKAKLNSDFPTAEVLSSFSSPSPVPPTPNDLPSLFAEGDFDFL
jgi:hypothetical protein